MNTNQRKQKSFTDLKTTNPAFNEVTNTWGSEKYTINGLVYYRRKNAIEVAQFKAKQAGKNITVLLNNVDFAVVSPTGYVEYIYDSSLDNLASPSLKEFLKQRKIAIN